MRLGSYFNSLNFLFLIASPLNELPFPHFSLSRADLPLMSPALWLLESLTVCNQAVRMAFRQRHLLPARTGVEARTRQRRSRLVSLPAPLM